MIYVLMYVQAYMFMCLLVCKEAWNKYQVFLSLMLPALFFSHVFSFGNHAFVCLEVYVIHVGAHKGQRWVLDGMDLESHTF